jgi:A/G-specific adenine glycosylase
MKLCAVEFVSLMPPFRFTNPPAQQLPEPAALLAWYDRHRRQLPWRTPAGVQPDPYRVWLSEIMLQQTTVATVRAYFDRFVVRWPNIAALAAAPLDDVLHQWQGLGYYARARNLHACARAIVERHGGNLPPHPAALRALPGIGDYTAAAIAAIAFDQPTAAVDGNGERVIARLYGVLEPLPAAKPRLKALAAGLVPERRAGDFAQALMDLGATICTPRRPRCVLCPWRPACAAAAAGVAETVPVYSEKPARPSRYGVAFWLTRPDGAVLLRRRPEKGLLGGMTEIPSTPWRAEPWTVEEAIRSAPAAAEWTMLPGVVRHGFTHFVLELAVMMGLGDTDGIWSRVDRLGEHALPTLMKKVARHATTAVEPRAAPPTVRRRAAVFPLRRSPGGRARRTAGGEA